jgi:hypothetical protein
LVSDALQAEISRNQSRSNRAVVIFMRFLLLVLQVSVAVGVYSLSAQSKEVLSWSELSETCIIYDYRPMIKNGEATELFFAIEPQNHNGGSIEKTYSRKKFKTAKTAYEAMLKDLIGFSKQKRCSSFSNFYPSKSKPESPM